MEITVSKNTKAIKTKIKVPGDKSISHRSVIFGSIASGLTTVENFLTGEDCICTQKAFEALGVETETQELARQDYQYHSNLKLSIKGQGIAKLIAPEKDIYLGNSGTGMRLLAGLFAGFPFNSNLTGDESLSKRPMKRVTKPLADMGAVIQTQDGKSPLVIQGSADNLKGIEYISPVASAQVKSSILLAGLNAKETVTVIEPEKSRDHLERMLEFFGAEISYPKVDFSEQMLNGVEFKANHANGFKVSLIDGIKQAEKLSAQNITVPNDISSAAFFMVAAAILENAEFEIVDVGINPTRIGILEVLKKMNVDFELNNIRSVCNEPIADIVVRSSDIKATEIAGDVIPRLIDEIPIISILAAKANGTTVIKDAAELKVKESNRIATTINMLNVLGVNVQETDDGMVIEGNSGKIFEPKSADVVIDSHGDHRLAMSSAIAALNTSQDIKILQTEFVNTSFPGFFDLLNSLN